MEKSATVEIIIIGNEILTGDILDTNTNWLAKLVHSRGGKVDRVTVVPDELSTIAEAVRGAVSRKVDIVFTTGGLGPTSDDLTLKGIAAGTDREVELHEEALEMVRKQYDYFFEQGIMAQGGLNPARETMAWLPRGAEPLFNAVGTAPGVFLKVGETAVISMPGVPSELKVIINQSLQHFLGEIFGEGEAMTKSVTVECNDESMLDPVLIRVVEEYPEIYTKSLATKIGETPYMDIFMTITGIGEKKLLLNKAFQELCNGLKEQGFELIKKESR